MDAKLKDFLELVSDEELIRFRHRAELGGKSFVIDIISDEMAERLIKNRTVKNRP